MHTQSNVYAQYGVIVLLLAWRKQISSVLLFVADLFIYILDSQQLTARCKRCLRFIDQAQANERMWTKGGETPIMMIAGQSSELGH